VGKLESRLREEENLRERINKLAENLAKGRKRYFKEKIRQGGNHQRGI
jgi:predicted DNA-binding protein